jgi:hypothetical protein
MRALGNLNWDFYRFGAFSVAFLSSISQKMLKNDVLQ